MKISMFKLFYNYDIIIAWILSLLIIIGGIIFTVCFFQGKSILDDFLVLFITVPLGLMFSVFPIVINYRQLTTVLLEKEKCTSYSFFNKKLCRVDYDKNVFYALFEVNFPRAMPIRFIAISNENFECDKSFGINRNGYKNEFYGS